MSEAARLEAVAARLEAVAARFEAGGVVVGAAPAGATGGGGAGAPPSVAAFQALMNGPMAKFVGLSNGIGGVTAESAGKVVEAFEAVGELISMATVCKKPADQGKVFAELSAGIKGVTSIKKPKDRKDPANLFLDAINGGIGGLGFVAVDSKSWETVQGGLDSFRYVGDKILMAYRKDGPQEYVDWQASYQTVLDDLKKIAKEHCPCGLAWQPAHSGKDVSEYTPGEVATSGGSATPATGVAPAAAGAAPAVGGAVGAWAAITNGSLAKFVQLSTEVGDEIAEMAGHASEAFAAVNELLEMSAVCKKPSDLGSVFGDLQAGLKATTGVKPPKRSSPLDLHYKCLSSSIGCLAFIAGSEKTWETVGSSLEEMEYNGNKLLQEFRKKNPNELYVNWHGSLKQLLVDVKAFAKDHTPMGLKWDMHGKDVSEYTPASKDPRAAKAAAPAAGGKGKGKGKGSGAPIRSAFEIKCEKEGLDPKVEMARLKAENAKKLADAAANPVVNPADALFAELEALGQSGGSMSKALGLKKTKKGTATDRAKVVSKAPVKKEAHGAKKKIVRPLKEGYEGLDLYKLAYCYGTRSSKERKTITLENPRKDAVLIMECDDVSIEIVGVAKNVSIAGCKRFNVTLEGSIGQVEVSNCGSGYVTINGQVYQITCDKCEGLEITLTEAAYKAKVVSSMCSSLNIALDNPDKSAEMELLTLAVPTQYESVLQFKGTSVQVLTEAVSHNFG